MKNSLAVEIAREARRVAPLKRELEGVRPGNFVFLFREGQLPAAVFIDKVNFTHAISSESNLHFRIKDGLIEPCCHGKNCYGRMTVTDPEARAAMERRNIERELDRAWAEFRTGPITVERALAVITFFNSWGK